MCVCVVCFPFVLITAPNSLYYGKDMFQPHWPGLNPSLVPPAPTLPRPWAHAPSPHLLLYHMQRTSTTDTPHGVGEMVGSDPSSVALARETRLFLRASVSLICKMGSTVRTASTLV